MKYESVFKIVKPVFLNFLGPRDQYSTTLSEGFIGVKGLTVFYIKPDGAVHETIDYPDLINMHLDSGRLLEIDELPSFNV